MATRMYHHPTPPVIAEFSRTNAFSATLEYTTETTIMATMTTEAGMKTAG
ncbi:Uncharacterised protein [Mycobacterium tuberculosis]|nr:Uncharacterised protein [Mycobacterium tuberculosis]